MASRFTNPQPINPLDYDLLHLAENARNEGFGHVDRLISEWSTGENTFSGAGEYFLGILSGDELVAIGGLNRDPFAKGDRIGRLRRFYVMPAYRRKGIGRRLLAALLEQAGSSFSQVRLRTTTYEASQFYFSCGFQKSEEPEATHQLQTTLSASKLTK